MAILQAEIKSILDNDSVIKTTLQYLVWDYWLTPDNEAAFDMDNGGRLRNNIVILHGDENPHPSPSRSGWYTWDAFPTIYIYGAAHATGKLTVTRARIRIEELLSGRRINAEEGRNITLQPDGTVKLEDSELFPGNVVAIARWRATGARALTEVA